MNQQHVLTRSIRLTSLSWLVVSGLLFGGGCYEHHIRAHEDADPGDGDADLEAPPDCNLSDEEVALNAYIEGTTSRGGVFGREPDNHITLGSGESLELSAVVDPDWDRPSLPDGCIDPIRFEWEYGEGETATGEELGPLTLTSSGTVTMTAFTAAGHRDLSPAVLYVAIEDCLFSDDFDRPEFAPDTHGWSERIADALGYNPSPAWELEEGQLHCDWGPPEQTDYCQPASQGILTRAEFLDARVTLRQRRGAPTPDTPHYSDVIMRYTFLEETPMGPNASFYRLRIREGEEEPGLSHCVALDLFRISASAAEYGFPVEDEGTNSLCGWPVGEDEWLVIDVTIHGTGPVFVDATISSSSNPAEVSLSRTFVDDHVDIVTEPGRFGLSQCSGETYFDDFNVQCLD